jgi:hypothetical protein
MVKTISEQVFDDGGYAANFKSEARIFGINYVAGQIRVHRVSGGPTRFGNRTLSARKGAQTRAIDHAAVHATKRIATLPREWHDCHGALYMTA